MPLKENYFRPKSCMTISFKAYVRGEGTEATDFETDYVIVLIKTNFPFDLTGNVVMQLDYNTSSSVLDTA